MKSLNRIKLLETTNNIEDLKKSLKKLKQLLKNKEDVSIVGFNPSFGLCTNTKLTVLPTLYVESLFEDWKHFSGDLEYPVQSFNSLSPRSYYKNQTNQYSGEHGKVRIKLAKYLIKKITKDLKNLAKEEEDGL